MAILLLCDDGKIFFSSLGSDENNSYMQAYMYSGTLLMRPCWGHGNVVVCNNGVVRLTRL